MSTSIKPIMIEIPIRIPIEASRQKNGDVANDQLAFRWGDLEALR